MSHDIKINKGVELMLRREYIEEEPPEPDGFKFNHKFTLLKKKFNLNFEFTWEDRGN